MIRKLFFAAALAVGIAAPGTAARYVTVSVNAGFHFVATFDMTTADSDGAVYADNAAWTADIRNNQFEVDGSTDYFVDYGVSVDLGGYDLSPSHFSYHAIAPQGDWTGWYLRFIDQYPFLDSVSGRPYDLSIVGTDSPQTVGLEVGDISTPPSAVPEPASWALMLGGFGLVGGAMRSRRKMAVSFG